jgi:hypothetical protein
LIGAEPIGRADDRQFVARARARPELAADPRGNGSIGLEPDYRERIRQQREPELQFSESGR